MRRRADGADSVAWSWASEPPLPPAVALALSTVSLRHHRGSKTLVVQDTREESK